MFLEVFSVFSSGRVVLDTVYIYIYIYIVISLPESLVKTLYSRTDFHKPYIARDPRVLKRSLCFLCLSFAFYLNIDILDSDVLSLCSYDSALPVNSILLGILATCSCISLYIYI